MIALSIRQPFAGAVATGWKTVENRSQMFTHRGTFLIHAGTRFHAWGERATAEPASGWRTVGRIALNQIGNRRGGAWLYQRTRRGEFDVECPSEGAGTPARSRA